MQIPCDSGGGGDRGGWGGRERGGVHAQFGGREHAGHVARTAIAHILSVPALNECRDTALRDNDPFFAVGDGFAGELAHHHTHRTLADAECSGDLGIGEADGVIIVDVIAEVDDIDPRLWTP